MDRETEAGYGAWCAIKNSLPSKTDILAVSGIRSFSGILNTLTPLAIPESCRDVFSIENLFISRYARAVHIVGRFFSSSSVELFTWLKGEFDFRNILLLLKNIYGFRNNEKTARMLFPSPTATVSPPNPANAATPGTIITAYRNSPASPLFFGIQELLDNTSPFYLIEFSVIINRYAQLYNAMRLLEKNDRHLLNNFLIGELSSLKNNIKEIAIPDNSGIKLRAIFTQLKKDTILTTERSSISETNIPSPAARFMDLSNARARINTVCKIIGMAEQP
jgi:hypothetical protein